MNETQVQVEDIESILGKAGVGCEDDIYNIHDQRDVKIFIKNQKDSTSWYRSL